MGELKTRPTDASVAAFLAQQSDPRRADCEAVAKMMAAATGEPAQMWGSGIVGFGRYAYTNSTKKTFEWPIVGFSPRKHKTGKSCLYLKKLDDVDAKVLRKLIDGSVLAMEPQRIRR